MKNPGIYIITNLINGMQYVGKTIDLSRRIKNHLSGWSKSTKGIHSAIIKYGAENFDVQVIPYPNISHQMLCIFERSHVAELDTYHNGYNQTLGGDGLIGYKHTDETRQKQSEAQRGEKSHNFGKKASKETLQKQSEVQKRIGNKPPNMGGWNKGIPQSEEQRRNHSQRMKGRTAWNKGKTNIYSDETRRQMAKGRKGKPAWNKGKSNLGMSQEAFTILVDSLLRDGWTQKKIAQELGKSPKTVRKYMSKST